MRCLMVVVFSFGYDVLSPFPLHVVESRISSCLTLSHTVVLYGSRRHYIDPRLIFSLHVQVHQLSNSVA